MAADIAERPRPRVYELLQRLFYAADIGDDCSLFKGGSSDIRHRGVGRERDEHDVAVLRAQMLRNSALLLRAAQYLRQVVPADGIPRAHKRFCHRAAD